MKEHNTTSPFLPLHNIRRTIPSLIISTLIFVSIPAHSQLPAGTTDTTQPQIQRQDPLLTQANEALDKQDYPTALKLLTGLAMAVFKHCATISTNAVTKIIAPTATYGPISCVIR